ncbi:MAG TPA: hypothetical protein IAA98_02570 [Candidatus Avipropionibacterium avicola]|uniref:Uncharacterized protein n=1 Tax=Candidatus Avipropionibacterium avicola TaxID=2840701 RepID=A0A9D1KKP8_9ACTN|nr:hypothetical protein [Candidatus Avipropionibacterium avicola]
MTEYRPEPTDAEIVGGEYQPYQTHPPQQDAQLVPRTVATPTPVGTEEDDDSEDSAGSHQFVLAIVSLGTGIPITAIAAESVDPGLLGLAVAWAGIIGVNLTHYLARKRRR